MEEVVLFSPSQRKQCSWKAGCSCVVSDFMVSCLQSDSSCQGIRALSEVILKHALSCWPVAHQVLGIKIYCSVSWFPQLAVKCVCICKAPVWIWHVTKSTGFSFFIPHSEQKFLNLGSTDGIQVTHTWDLEKTLSSLQFPTRSITFHSGEEATERPAAHLLLNVLMQVQMQASHGSALVKS